MELKEVEQLTNEKWLNLYNLHFDKDGKDIVWTMASRQSKNELMCITKQAKHDAVCIVPHYKNKDDEDCLIVIKEFRLPMNKYVYGFPAGLIDLNESYEISAIRELKEEIGAKKVENIRAITGFAFNSEGLTDETTITVEADIIELDKQDLQDDEDISVIVVPIKEIKQFLADKECGAKLALYANFAYEKYLLEQKIKQLENK